MRTCLKFAHKNGKNAKMNSSTQKSFTLKNVWKIIFEKLIQKLTHFLTFYVECIKYNIVFNEDYLENGTDSFVFKYFFFLIYNTYKSIKV